MRTDTVIFADFVECRGHHHVQWCCPDCGSIGFAPLEAGTEPFRIVCELSAREFLVILGELPEFMGAIYRQGSS